MEIKNKEVAEIGNEIDTIKAEIETLEKQLQDKKDELAAKQAKVQELVKEELKDFADKYGFIVMAKGQGGRKKTT